MRQTPIELFSLQILQSRRRLMHRKKGVATSHLVFYKVSLITTYKLNNYQFPTTQLPSPRITQYIHQSHKHNLRFVIKKLSLATIPL